MVDIGLQPLINYVRERGQAAVAEVFDGVTYWTDAQIEDILLRTGQDVSIKARPVSRFTKVVYRLDIPRFYWFNATGLIVRDENEVVLSGWTFNAQKGTFTFLTEKTSAYLFVEGFLVQTFASLELLWEEKANQRSHYVNFRGGHNATNLAQEWEHCDKMRMFYASKVVKGWKRR